ncbi:MAG: hypothetical protein IPK19_15745 [Chloroflexi bacterium]|nr:hypothetical protein [Chloroflexota bacterium]
MPNPLRCVRPLITAIQDAVHLLPQRRPVEVRLIGSAMQRLASTSSSPAIAARIFGE